MTANYVFSIFSASTPVYGSLVPSIGVLITGLVMLKGIFKRAVAYLGVVAGIIGIVAGLGFLSPALAILDVLNLILFGIWLLLVGWKLYTLGRR